MGRNLKKAKSLVFCLRNYAKMYELSKLLLMNFKWID